MGKEKTVEKKRIAEKVFSLIGGFLVLTISLIAGIWALATDNMDFKIILLLISSLVIIVSGFLLNKKTSLAFSLIIIFSIIGLLANVWVFIFPFIFILIGLFTGIIKGRTIGNFIFSTFKAIIVSILLASLIIYLGFFQPIISKNNEVNNLITKLDNLERDFKMAGTENNIQYDIYKEYSQMKTDLDTAIKSPPALWIFFPGAYKFIIIDQNFQKMVDTANMVEYMKSRVFPEGYIAKQTQDIIKEYVDTGVIKAVEIPCDSDIDCLYLYTCVNHQCKSRQPTKDTGLEEGQITDTPTIEKPECHNNSECGGLGWGCLFNKCIRVAVNCDKDSDCPVDSPICNQNFGMCTTG